MIYVPSCAAIGQHHVPCQVKVKVSAKGIFTPPNAALSEDLDSIFAQKVSMEPTQDFNGENQTTYFKINVNMSVLPLFGVKKGFVDLWDLLGAFKQ